jgi:hypothetical protein
MMAPNQRTAAIKVGDHVAYCEQFLDQIGQEFTNVKTARGKVLGLIMVHEGLTMAEIEWDAPYLPNRVDVRNLTKSDHAPSGE